MFDEIAEYFDNILSKYQCGFRKGFIMLFTIGEMEQD